MAVDPDKDVDGLHPINMGRLALGMPGPVPCTPAGIEALLAHYGIPVSGREVCILGRGTTLGRPLATITPTAPIRLMPFPQNCSNHPSQRHSCRLGQSSDPWPGDTLAEGIIGRGSRNGSQI